MRVACTGAVHHVTSRDDWRQTICHDDEDRSAQLAVIAHAMDRFDAQVLAYCLVGDPFNLMLHTRPAKLCRPALQLNGIHGQGFNRRHGMVVHLFQGRFRAMLVDRNAYLAALCCCVERNPVAAGIVAAPKAQRLQPLAWLNCREQCNGDRARALHRPYREAGVTLRPWRSDRDCR